MNDYSLFSKQLRQLASSGADGQEQVERIRALVELQRQAHSPDSADSPRNIVPMSGRRQVMAID